MVLAGIHRKSLGFFLNCENQSKISRHRWENLPINQQGKQSFIQIVIPHSQLLFSESDICSQLIQEVGGSISVDSKIVQKKFDLDLQIWKEGVK